MKLRVLSFVLALLLTIGMCPTFAATENGDGADSRAVKLLDALGIMEIDEDTHMIWDESPIERREMVRILCKLLNLEATRDATPKFSDVSDKDRPFVETVVRNGYMSGYQNGNFGPYDYITREQLITIFVTVMGADSLANVMGGYPQGYVLAAKRLGIFDSKMGDLKGNAKRIEAANLIYDALHADMLTLSGIYGGKADYYFKQGSTFLSEQLSIYTGEGILTQNEATSLDSNQGIGEGLVKVGDTVLKDPDRVADDYLGYNVKVYSKRITENDFDTVLYVEEVNKNSVLTIEDDDFISVEGFKVNYYKNDKKTYLEMATSCFMIYNGEAVTFDPSRFKIKNGFAEFVDNDGNNKYDVVKITEYKHFVVKNVNADKNEIALMHGQSTISLSDKLYRIIRDGSDETILDIGTGEVLLVAEADSLKRDRAIRIEVVSDSLLGSMKRVFTKDGSKYVEISGKEYKLSQYCLNLIENDTIPTPESGKTSGQFYTDGRGNIVYYNASNGSMQPGYLVATSFSEKGFDTSCQIRIFTQDGKAETFDVGDKITVNGTVKKREKIADDYNLYEKLTTPQLVEFAATDGVIKKISFAENAYNPQEFSLDFSANIECTSKNILDYRFSVTAQTLVMRVPSGDKKSSSFMKDMTEPTNYRFTTGSYFVQQNWYNVKLYDIDTDGIAKYAVLEYNPNSSDIWETAQMILVTDVCDEVDENGDSIKTVCGYNESGNYVELTGTSDKNTAYDSALKREAKAGDVIQYRNDTLGRLAEVFIQQDIDSLVYYSPSNMNSVDSKVTKFFGKAIKATSSTIHLVSRDVWENMTPLDTEMIVNNTGKAVYIFDKETGKVTKSSFAFIEKGDEIFACVNESNYTRMVVIYRESL